MSIKTTEYSWTSNGKSVTKYHNPGCPAKPTAEEKSDYDEFFKGWYNAKHMGYDYCDDAAWYCDAATDAMYGN